MIEWASKLGGASGEAHGVAELAVTHELAREGGLTPHGAAELAHDPRVALVEVDALAHEWSALAVCAAVAVGRERSYAAPQEEALELLYIAIGGDHARTFAAPA
jgi:hypothetical protein